MLSRIWGLGCGFRGGRRIWPLLAPRVPLRYALPGLFREGNPGPACIRGVCRRHFLWASAKGRGLSPLPFESFQGGPGGHRNLPGFLFGGRGGEIETPHVSGGGAGGGGVFASKTSPLSRPRRGHRNLTGHPAKGAWTYTGAHPGLLTIPHWGWCGRGCPPPPESGW